MGMLWLLALLPWSIQHRLGAAIGSLLLIAAKQRREDTAINLSQCFPELTPQQQSALTKDIFKNAGIGLMEYANAWFRSPDYYRDKLTIEGLEHLHNAEKRGRGILLLGAHYSQMDLAAAMCSPHFKVDTVYRPQKNQALERIMIQRRSRYHSGLISYRDMRSLMRSLKGGRIVWYTPDQDFGKKHSVFAPFFGVPAATITTPTRLQAVSDSTVLFIHFFREQTAERYTVKLVPAPTNYPSGNDQEDAITVNRMLESLIRRAPAQYMWYHRRFKTRPDDSPQLYAEKRKWKKKRN